MLNDEQKQKEFEQFLFEKEKSRDDDFGTSIGPLPLPSLQIRNYGSQLLDGEGEAMASYIQDKKRIPRRGEVGHSADDIDKYEAAGFVMSGNRHKRMTAVRLKKEGQVLNLEEQREKIKESLQQQAIKEHKIVANLRDLLQKKTASAHHK